MRLNRGLMITARPWTASEVSAKVTEKSENLLTSSVLSLGNVYGSASWKRLGLNAQLCWNAVAVLLQHY